MGLPSKHPSNAIKGNGWRSMGRNDGGKKTHKWCE